MKKKAFAILTLCISLFAAVALVGCSGSGGATGSSGGSAEKPAVDMRTDFIWFKVEVPEGVEITDFKPARAFVLEQQHVVVHTHRSPWTRANYL